MSLTSVNYICALVLVKFLIVLFLLSIIVVGFHFLLFLV